MQKMVKVNNIKS